MPIGDIGRERPTPLSRGPVRMTVDERRVAGETKSRRSLGIFPRLKSQALKRCQVIPRFVELTPYNPQWPALFQAERASLLDACRGLVKSAHHIGSTAVPGMSAKPIIDMLALLGQNHHGLACIEHMDRLGYEYRGDGGIEGRHYFRRGTPRAYHVHMYAADHPEVRRHLMFRNYLRSHRDEALAYEALKWDLAARFGSDPRAYTSAKKAFCDRIDNLARSASRDAPDPI